MTIIIESVTLPERGPVNLHLDVATTINISAKEAQRKVSVFVGNTIADLLTGEMPSLVWQRNMAFWRVPVILSSRSMGRIGIVGTIDVNVYNGNLHINDQIIEEIEENAQRFAAGAAL
ncbi:MAG: hypothetical protein KDE56_20690 [Anaerolineales bacterium]|nr:hypothetical protein [Anaerolineales bacterium]